MSARGDYRLRLECDSESHPAGNSPHVIYGDNRNEAVRKARLAGWKIRTHKKSDTHKTGRYSGDATCAECWKREQIARGEAPF